MTRRIIAAVSLATALGGGIAIPVLATASSASADGVCVHLDLNVNGTAQVIDQCVPPAS
jgi:hypothetical protein